MNESEEDVSAREEEGATRGVSKSPPETIWGVMSSPITRNGLRIIVITQIAQQACGINAGKSMKAC